MKLTRFSLAAIALISVFSIVAAPLSAKAVSGSDFKPGRIIDDAVFTNKNAMSVQQIQDFLNAKVPSCETWHSAYNANNPPPYTCLKDYSEGGKSAAQIIWEASQAYNINPQVMIVLLQKEQALVTDTWPLVSQFTKATGYLCPDTAACNNAAGGFSKQVFGAAWQFRNDLDGIDTPGFWSVYGKGWNNIRYNPNAACGTKSVYIENQATAVLYKYTPYTPNDSALNNLYGSGDACGAYGNRNFWRYFNDWFGSTVGPRYDWQIVSFTYAGGDNNISVNTPEHVVLKARNTGRVPWYNHGDSPVRLGTWAPADHQSSLINNGARFATVSESVVLPNEIGTFEFDIKSGNIGTIVEPMNLVAENSEWANWPGFSPTINVNNGYSWQIDSIIYENGTGVMEPGTKQLVTVKAKNTGNLSWSKLSGPQIKLGTWLPQRASDVGSTWPSSTRAALMNETTVAPGEIAGFQFYVTVPRSGIFYERLNLVAEGQSWFNDTGLTLYLYGKRNYWEPVWHNLSTPSANINRNTDFTITFKAKNIGETTWKKDAPYPIRLATAGPQNRGTALYHASWINPIRPASLQENSVAPGEVGTFMFTARTPNVPGERFERFSLVAEGLEWLNDPGYTIYINVL